MSEKGVPISRNGRITTQNGIFYSNFYHVFNDWSEFFRGQLIKFERYDDDSDDEFFLWYG